MECPTGSGQLMTMGDVAQELGRRPVAVFERYATGRRPAHGDATVYAEDPLWKDLILFYEYFHADTGRGLGASHQTGWTSLVATLLHAQLDPAFDHAELQRAT